MLTNAEKSYKKWIQKSAHGEQKKGIILNFKLLAKGKLEALLVEETLNLIWTAGLCISSETNVEKRGLTVKTKSKLIKNIIFRLYPIGLELVSVLTVPLSKQAAKILHEYVNTVGRSYLFSYSFLRFFTLRQTVVFKYKVSLLY